MRIFAVGTKMFGGACAPPRPQRRTAPASKQESWCDSMPASLLHQIWAIWLLGKNLEHTTFNTVV